MRIQASPIELAASPRPDAARIEHAARQLEAQFAQLLIKSMRDASFGDSLFPGENQTYRDLYDQQLATALTRGKGLGLAPLIARQLSRQAGVDGGAEAPALDTRITPGRAAAARAYAEQARALGAVPAVEQALDLIAGRDGAAAEAGSPLDALVARLLADRDAAVDATGPGPALAAAAEQAAAEFAPHSPERFVASIWHHAQAAARELGVDARALVAQAALETGWGRKQIGRGDGRSSHNLFGIKATGWNGDRVTAGTHEYVNGQRRRETAQFRAYASPAESFADYVRLLKQNPRYRQALQSGGDVGRFASALQKAGYATDPSYAAKITAIANGPTIGRAVRAIAGIAARMEADASGAGRMLASAAGAGDGAAIRR